MAQIVTCPECTKALQVPDGLIGKTVQCPECKSTFTAAVESENDGADEPEPIKATKSPGRNRKTKTENRDRDDDDPDVDDEAIDSAKRSRKRGDQKPGKVMALGIMMLSGGIFAILVSLGLPLFTVGTCCIWPGTYYSLVLGILAIVRGAGLLGASAHEQPVPSGIAIMMIINIVAPDPVNCVLGIICLIFCGDEEVTNYLARP